MAEFMASLVIPVRNEAETVVPALKALQPLRRQGVELVVVDGESADDTAHRIHPWADQALSSARGRARQMNTGARAARGEYLFFLHIDTVMPDDVLGWLAYLHKMRPAWGYFAVRLSGCNPLLRVVERCMNWRARLTDVATGDQVQFMHRDVFWVNGGYPEIPLMEDVCMAKRLRQQAAPLRIRSAVTTSSRRWESHGIVRTVLLMWWLRLLFWLRVDPIRLSRLYDRA